MMRWFSGEPAIRTIRTEILVAIATLTLVIAGCDAPVDSAEGPVSTVDDAGVRDWRIVYFGWDNNELAGAVADDVAELVAANLPEDAFHCIAVRDSVLANGTIELIRRGGTTAIPVPVENGARLFDRSTITTVRRFLEETFPSRKEIVVIAAHGRGWRGIGSDSTDPGTLLPAADIPLLFGHDSEISAGTIPRIVVFDISYGASAEILTGLNNSTDRVVAAAGPRNDSGVDFERVGHALNAEAGRAPSLETAHAMFADEFRRTVPDHTVACSAAELTEIPTAVELFAHVTSATVSTRDRQNQLQSALLAAAVIPDLPGDVYVTAGEVAHALDIASIPIPENVLFHLVRLDEVGVPAGHDTGYLPYRESTELTPAFTDVAWPPDLVRRRGVLFEVWYRQF